MNSIPFRQRLWESFPTKTVGKLALSSSFLFFFINVRLIYKHFGVVAHALGKARPHGQPGRRGAGHRSGLRPTLLWELRTLFYLFFFINVRLIYKHFGVVAHALGKARPHGRPGRRGAGRRSGIRPTLLWELRTLFLLSPPAREPGSRGKFLPLPPRPNPTPP
jgi:hypothetical protein